MEEKRALFGQKLQTNPGFGNRVAQAHESTAAAHDATLKYVRAKIDDKQGIWPIVTPFLGLLVCGIGLYSTGSAIANYQDIKDPSKEEKNERVFNWIFLGMYVIITLYFLWRFGMGLKVMHHGNKGVMHERMMEMHNPNKYSID